MALIMVGFLVMIPVQGNLGCGGASSADEQIEEDIARYQAAVLARPDDVAALKALAETYVARANQQPAGSEAQRADWRLAIDQYEKALAVLAKQKGAEARDQRVKLLGQLVDVYLFMGDYQSAANVYPRIVRLTPNDAQSYFSWATVAVSAGDTNMALLAFNKYLELDPDSPQADEVKDWIKENTAAPTASPSPTEEAGS